MDRLERLMTIPAAGPITALTAALEVRDVQRLSSIKKAISYCGLCGAKKSTGNTVIRTPLSVRMWRRLLDSSSPLGSGELLDLAGFNLGLRLSPWRFAKRIHRNWRVHHIDDIENLCLGWRA